MPKNNPSRFRFYTLQYSFHIRESAILLLFTFLTIIMLYPLSTNLASIVGPEPDDPLLNVWRMQWNAHAFLGGPTGIANLFNTNIFYPFPLTLAYSEHFLMISAQALPFLALADSHLVGLNLSVLITFILSGYGMYLLVTDWTGSRWAGLVAGMLFAYSPHRFGQLNHLELLVTQWMPLTLLALHWTLTRPGLRYPLLFGLFFNLQALSGFHYTLNLTLACGLLVLVYSLTGRVIWRRGLWIAGVLSMLATVLFNWPIWRMYLHFSDVMGAIRTPGEVRIYSAALTDYFTTIPHNLFYGWTFGRWQMEGHQFQPLMPVGVVGLLLGLIALLQFWILDTSALLSTGFGFWIVGFKPASRITHPCPEQSRRDASRIKRASIIFLVLLTLLSLILSFGLNENALGSSLAPILKYSPYFWLYDNVIAFQGIRVPGRYGILVVLSLTALAGWGVAQISIWIPNLQRQSPNLPISNNQSLITNYQLPVILITALILLETWSAPLCTLAMPCPEFPSGQNSAPVYHWLHNETTTDTVILELPFEGSSEFIYEYNSSHHWRRMANGGTGFTPPIYKELRQWFNAFPDPRAVDVIQQLGIDLVILHQDAYQPNAWQRVLAELPLYLPAIEQIYQFDNALVLRIAKPLCQPDQATIKVALTPTELDGLPRAIEITYHNLSPAAFVANVQQISRLTFAQGADKNFTEPLVTPAGETQSVVVPLQDEQRNLSGAWLATLNRSVSQGGNEAALPLEIDEEILWQSLGLKYADGPQLSAYALTPENPTACNNLITALQWTDGDPSDSVLVQLLDPFGRVIAEDVTQPWLADSDNVDIHYLPLVGALPAGRYGLRVFVKDANGAERFPVTEDGVTIPANQIPPLPVVIHPGPHMLTSDDISMTFLDGSITLLGGNLTQESVRAGEWLRFALVWQAEQPLETDLTVFTQLLGPDGQVWGQRDNRPGGGWYDVSFWQPFQPIVDEYAFQIQPDAPPGTYRLIAGLYQSDTLERLPVQTGGDFVEIGTVIVE